MLNKPCDAIVTDEQGRVTGVTSQGETARCKQIICDPSYAIDHCKMTGHVSYIITEIYIEVNY